MIALPLFGGAVQLTCARLDAGSALTPVGAPGGIGPVGVIEAECADGGPLPLGLEAWTVKVYG